MNGRLIFEEQYKSGIDVLNFVVYASTTTVGNDEVLQHKLMGTVETAHITLHPDGTVNFTAKRGKMALETAMRTNLHGYSPEPSARLRQFLVKVRGKF